MLLFMVLTFFNRNQARRQGVGSGGSNAPPFEGDFHLGHDQKSKRGENPRSVFRLWRHKLLHELKLVAKSFNLRSLTAHTFQRNAIQSKWPFSKVQFQLTFHIIMLRHVVNNLDEHTILLSDCYCFFSSLTSPIRECTHAHSL